MHKEMEGISQRRNLSELLGMDIKKSPLISPLSSGPDSSVNWAHSNLNILNMNEHYSKC